MEKLETAPFGIGEERVVWEGLASACAPPLRRLGAFVLVGFVFFLGYPAVVQVLAGI